MLLDACSEAVICCLLFVASCLLLLVLLSFVLEFVNCTSCRIMCLVIEQQSAIMIVL